MTLSTATSRVPYPGTGTTGPFTIPFRFLVATDLRVTKLSGGVETTLVNGTDFSTTGAGNATGTLTLTTALQSGETLTIRRDPPLTQPTSIRNQGEYFPSTIEDMNDRVAMQLQALKDVLDRSIKLRESLPGSPALVELTPDTGKVVTGTGTGFTMSALDSSATSLPGDSRTVATVSAYLANNAVFNVKDYGAIGNGGANDTAAFNLARARQVAAGGGIIWAPRGTYLVSALPASGVVPFVLYGEGEGTVIQTTATAVVACQLGDTAPGIEGCYLKDFWLKGTSTNLGGIALGNGPNYAAFMKLDNVRISGFTGVGAYGVSLTTVQELDAVNCRIQGNYNNVYRPNLGYCTAVVFHGQKGYIGFGTNRGVSLEGIVADITFRHQTIESNYLQGIFASGYASNVNIFDCWFEGNNVSGTAGLAQVDLSGAAANPVRAQIAGNQWHIPNLSVGRHLRFDYVTVTKFENNYALLSMPNSILTTANTSALHLEDNADPSGDMVALYRTLVGYGTAVTFTDTDANGKRTEGGNRRLENVHLTATQQTPPAIAVHANAGTGATATLDANASDLCGQVTLTNGSGAWASGVQCTITFNRAYASPPKVFLTPANDPAGAAFKDMHAYVASTTAQFTIEYGIAATSGLVEKWNYWVCE